MDLIKQLLAGNDPSEILLKWPEPETSQAILKAKAQLYLQDFSKNKSLILSLLTNPSFSLTLTPTLIKQSLESNSLEIIEAVLKFKGKQLMGKELGKIFEFLSNCSIPASFLTSKGNYKPFKVESSRQGLSLKRSERIRYYLFTLCISSSIGRPKVKSLNTCAILYFSFMIRYYMTHTSDIQISPLPDRLFDFISSATNGPIPPSSLFELNELNTLLDIYTKFSESSHFILSVLTCNPEIIPSKPLESFSKVHLL